METNTTTHSHYSDQLDAAASHEEVERHYHAMCDAYRDARSRAEENGDFEALDWAAYDLQCATDELFVSLRMNGLVM